MTDQCHALTPGFIEVVADLLAVDPQTIDDTDSIVDLVEDSIMMIELAVELQDRFGVLLVQEDLATVVTLRDLRELIDARI